MDGMDFTNRLLDRTRRLSEQVDALNFSFDGYIYNPLDYAWELHSQYLERYVKQDCDVLFLGMNPGPFGMMQTGVPFGEVDHVRLWLGIYGNVGKPESEHPNRPVVGLDINRNEISGQRFWSLMADHYKEPDAFARQCCVFNYCPLGFLLPTKTAKNETPDHLPKEERKALESVCDSYLCDVIELVRPKFLLGVGKYAMEKLQAANKDGGRVVSSIIHPSPGNPQANKGWAEKTSAKLQELGIWQ